ncbi:MAG: alpha-glucan family phosphorylase [Salinivirgaceae bacterium]|jgi:phosphorylase/glycogen(starch) synthase|nr:alpha-glucan family phosphorylase [Salinivirgaceae bacterium]
MTQKNKPEYLFETSWEICNKIGGIHTVIATKAASLLAEYGRNLVLIGPDTTRYSDGNIEFEEDRTLFPQWAAEAAKDGFRIRTGRWKIEGKPIVILIDFTANVPQKDSILTDLWEGFGVDSLTGQWDYVEPAIFGYTAGQVIEHFVDFNLSPRHKVIAHFHEWMTGSGVLYIERHAPWIATVFTTHATTMGRAMSGNGVPLYTNMEHHDVEKYARQYNMVAKYSLEKQAAHNADVFTTVSDITAQECKFLLDKVPDVVTPNGFDMAIVPDKKRRAEMSDTTRSKLFNVVETLYGKTIKKDALVIVISGRYEWKNKGIDVFLEAFERINTSNIGRQLIPLLLVPGGHGGVRNELLNALKNNSKDGVDRPYLTHVLHNRDNDPVVNAIELSKLYQKKDVFPLFVPCYLNGNDGIFDIPYYEMFVGGDIGVFPSYYEPWGYTPLESVAFGVPAITTSLAGFGAWISDKKNIADGACVIDRTDDNDNHVIDAIVKQIEVFAKLTNEQVIEAKDAATSIASKAQWSNLVDHYHEAYANALELSSGKSVKMRPRKQFELPQLESDKINNPPRWTKMVIQSNLPKELSGLIDISNNLWCTWNFEVARLFKSMDEELWYATERNPIALLNKISKDRLEALLADDAFMQSYHELKKAFESYVKQKSDSEETVAYFSMEYGFHDNLKIYSGGLGILAGDYLKEASDNKLNLISVGFLYRYGYFKQQFTLSGEQQAILEPHNFTDLPVTPLKDEFGNPVLVGVDFPGRSVYLKVWLLEVGRNPLYLLDADNDFNNPEDRSITHQLYGGNWENRLKQEIALGFGGIRLLRHLGYNIDIYHLNEGHAAFINLERIGNLVQEEKLTFDEALEVVRARSLFTTHTPVPAGHDVFEEDLLRMYLRHLPERLGITWENMIQLGRMTPQNNKEPFSMSVLAANTSQEMNGVSELHGKVSREMFQKLYKGYFANESHISYVTNGVHYPTWTAKEWKRLHESYFAEGFYEKVSDRSLWKRIYDVPDEEIWGIRQLLRQKLIDFIKERFEDNWVKRNDNPRRIMQVINTIESKTLTIGFARRFATYKRAHLLFTDTERLKEIVNNPERPVQFVFAGKAHPADKAGQDIIKYIIEISQRPEFAGKIIFIENYDILLAKRLVKGVDVWLNTPTRPLEASGTSGIKATLNGVLNYSVLDGWWREGYKPNAGWALQEERVYENQEFQNELDAVNIYATLENEIIPAFYDRNEKDIPVRWIEFIKNNIAQIAPEFTTHRMLHDYIDRFYKPLMKSGKEIMADNYKLATDIAMWKQHIYANWEEIEVVNVDFPDTSKHDYKSGHSYHGEVVLSMTNLKPEEIGIDLVLSDEAANMREVTDVFQLKYEKSVDNMHFYSIEMELENPGTFEYGLRIYPRNSALKYRTEFNLVRWI